MVDLPGCGVQTDKPPFYKVGVDYFGPFWLSREEVKLKNMDVYFHV